MDSNEHYDEFFDIEAQTVIRIKNKKNNFNYNHYLSLAGFLLLIAAFIILCISGFLSNDSSINESINSVSSKKLLSAQIGPSAGELWFEQQSYQYSDLFDQIYAKNLKTEYEIWDERCNGNGCTDDPILCELCQKPRTKEVMKEFHGGKFEQYHHALPKVALLERYKDKLNQSMPKEGSLVFAKAPNTWSNDDIISKISAILKDGKVVNPFAKYANGTDLIKVTSEGWGGANGYGYITGAGWTTDDTVIGDKKIERWYPNFADQNLWYAGKFYLTGQDEQMSLEMPVLWGLRNKFNQEMEADPNHACKYTIHKARQTDFKELLKNCKHQLFNGAIVRNLPQFFQIDARNLAIFGDQYELYEMSGGTRSDDGKWTMMKNYAGTTLDKLDANWKMHYNGYQFKVNADDKKNFKFRGDDNKAWIDTNNIYMFAAINRGNWAKMAKWEWGNNAQNKPYELRPRQVRICRGDLIPNQIIEMTPKFPGSQLYQNPITGSLCSSRPRDCKPYGRLKEDHSILFALWNKQGKKATLSLNSTDGAKTEFLKECINDYSGVIHLCYDDSDVSGKLIWFGTENHNWQRIQDWKWGQKETTPVIKNLSPKQNVMLCPHLSEAPETQTHLGTKCSKFNCTAYTELSSTSQEKLLEAWQQQGKKASIFLRERIDGLVTNTQNAIHFCYHDAEDKAAVNAGGTGGYIWYGSYKEEGNNLPYTKRQSRLLFRKAFTTFALIKATADPGLLEENKIFIEQHLGNWGGGIFQNDVIANLLIQFVAAASTGIDGIVYHDPPKNEIVKSVPFIQQLLEEMSSKVFKNNKKMTLAEFLEEFEKVYIKTKRFKFGEITSWMSSDDEAAQTIITT